MGASAVFSAFAASMLLVGLAACGDATSVQSTTAGSPSSEATGDFAVTNPGGGVIAGGSTTSATKKAKKTKKSKAQNPRPAAKKKKKKAKAEQAQPAVPAAAYRHALKVASDDLASSQAGLDRLRTTCLPQLKPGHYAQASTCARAVYAKTDSPDRGANQRSAFFPVEDTAKGACQDSAYSLAAKLLASDLAVSDAALAAAIAGLSGLAPYRAKEQAASALLQRTSAAKAQFAASCA